MSATRPGRTPGGGPSPALAAFLERARRGVDAELDRRLPPAGPGPAGFAEALRYAVFAGGKRVRPALVLLGGEAHGAPPDLLWAPGAAVEMIHTYSLVHDDLPALDDDDLRRGRPTVHRAFGEATAILVGDTLLTHGLTLLARAPEELPAAQRAAAVARVGEAIGFDGMIGGQVDDLLAERAWPADAASALDSIHRRKTGALLTASLRLGGAVAGVAEGSPEDRTLERLGEAIGMAFQIADDLLDIEGSASRLGKTPGKDAERRKLTYPQLHGIAASRARLGELVAEGFELCRRLPARADVAAALVAFLAGRDA